MLPAFLQIGGRQVWRVALVEDHSAHLFRNRVRRAGQSRRDIHRRPIALATAFMGGCRRRRTGRALPSPRPPTSPIAGSMSNSLRAAVTTRTILSVRQFSAFVQWPHNAERATALDDDSRVRLMRNGRCGFRHFQAFATSLRAMMRRMISLVSSMSWWTRKSRTIFSMPYSLK